MVHLVNDKPKFTWVIHKEIIHMYVCHFIICATEYNMIIIIDARKLIKLQEHPFMYVNKTNITLLPLKEKFYLSYSLFICL